MLAIHKESGIVYSIFTINASQVTLTDVDTGDNKYLSYPTFKELYELVNNDEAVKTRRGTLNKIDELERVDIAIEEVKRDSQKIGKRKRSDAKMAKKDTKTTKATPKATKSKAKATKSKAKLKATSKKTTTKKDTSKKTETKSKRGAVASDLPYSAKVMAEELGTTTKLLRAKFRTLGIEKPGNRWEWSNKKDYESIKKKVSQ